MLATANAFRTDLRFHGKPGGCPDLIIRQEGQLGAKVYIYFPHRLGTKTAITGDPG